MLISLALWGSVGRQGGRGTSTGGNVSACWDTQLQAGRKCSCDTHCQCNSLLPLLLSLCSVFLLCLFLGSVSSFLPSCTTLARCFLFYSLLFFVISIFFYLIPSLCLCPIAFIYYCLFNTHVSDLLTFYLTALFVTFPSLSLPCYSGPPSDK